MHTTAVLRNGVIRTVPPMISSSDLNLYLQFFKGREDYFAQQHSDFYRPVDRALDEFYLRRHLDGDLTFGLYVLDSASCCYLICIDIDIPKNELDKVDFADPEHKYAWLRNKIDAVLEALCSKFAVPMSAILVEDSGGRGYHVWVFFDGPVKGRSAVKFGSALKDQLEFEIEFFPKQGYLSTSRKYGNLIKLPLGIHRKYGARSSFFSLTTDGLRVISDINENLDYLRSLVPLSAEEFEASVIGMTEVLTRHEGTAEMVPTSDSQRIQFEGHASVLIDNCTAMHDLRAKGGSAIRFSHSEAFLFADVMLSVSGGADIVHDTMRRSLASDYDWTRTQDEIERIKPLHAPSCLTLVRKKICPAYCKESVRKRNEDPLGTGTTPCSVWLQRIPLKHIPNPEKLVERIGTAENIKRSFFQLRQYHEHEDSLFYDPFDFDQFETQLDVNCALLARSLFARNEPPFLGYMQVPIPKKINEAQELEYRGMSYSTVYDQAPIQAIFNEVAPFLENQFQPSSYGYRWNTDDISSYRIFEDWRKAYPRFRSAIMSALEVHPSGFHFCCDIKGYYDHVDHNILLEQLRRCVPDDFVLQMIERAVRAYSFENGGRCGLPQGPAYARLLANLYLNEFDVYATQIAAGYFRYVDDFVLVFKTEDHAVEGLELVVRHLSSLGLELSEDESKRAVITSNTDISRVRKTLDRIRYGMLEGSRHIEHLAPQAVADFMEAVDRHSFSPMSTDELLQINDALPSLLYVVSRDTSIPHRLRSKIVDNVEFLIRHRWFFPKKLKSIFYRLLDLESDENRLHELFKAMEPTHKVYLLLSVYGIWQSHGDRWTLLVKLIQVGLREDNVYVVGFSLAISAKVQFDIDGIIDRDELMAKLSGPGCKFALLKWLPFVDYLDQTEDERAMIRHIIGPRSPELFKMLLLSKLTKLPSFYVDSVYLSGIIGDWGVLILPKACELLVMATDKVEMFDALTKLVVARLAFKPLLISHLSKLMFDKRASAGLAEIENLRLLYARITDEELKECMLGALSRIMKYGPVSSEEFAKQHKQIARYNGCYLFERIDPGGRYDYLELVPEDTLRENIRCDLEMFNTIVDDFYAKDILPRSTVLYHSGNAEFRIEYNLARQYRDLDPADFTLADESVSRACILASEVYRKASYIRQLTGKSPHIDPENLLVDRLSGTVVFRAIGHALCGLHVVNGTTIGNEEADIARMIASLLEDLLFKSKAEVTEFLKATPHSGIGAFLSLFILRLKAKDTDRRYTSSQFAYLVDLLHHPKAAQGTNHFLEVTYLRERLRGSLFRHNSNTPSWQGICRALDDHLGPHLRSVCSREALLNFPYRSRLLLSGKNNRQLHVVSRQLLDFSLCRQDFPDAEKCSPAYLDLLEFLLLYTSICIEFIALARTGHKRDALEGLVSTVLLTGDRVRVIADGYETVIFTKDLAALVIRQPKQNSDEPSAGLSLRQLALLALLGCGIECGDDVITIIRPQGLRHDVFQAFAHACLFRIPKIELAVEQEMMELFARLRSNEDFGRLKELEKMRDAASILFQDLHRVRTSLGISRCSGRADGRYFPPDVRCRSRFKGELRAKENTLISCGLTNMFPSSRTGYNCSWDMNDGKPMTLIIPSEGLHSLVQDLMIGKVFGRKLSSLYTGRLMALWDFAAFAVTTLALGVCAHTMGADSASSGVRGFCGVLTYFLGPLVLAILSKLLFDIGHWSPRYQTTLMNILSIFKSKGRLSNARYGE